MKPIANVDIRNDLMRFHIVNIRNNNDKCNNFDNLYRNLQQQPRAVLGHLTYQFSYR